VGTINPGAGYQAGTTYPGAANTTTYSSNYYTAGPQQGVYPGTATGATPGYTSRGMPGMAGYNAVNPMATTLAPGYNYAGTAGMPYATGTTTGNSPAYGAPGYYTMQPQTYPVRQRRGLFGFWRRNRVAYPASPSGAMTYGTTPSGYATYGTTTYYSTPATYTYRTSPY
jgi:hypothetical protein